MKKIVLFLALSSLSFISAGSVTYSSPTNDKAPGSALTNIDVDPEFPVLIVNLSSIPLRISNNTSSGGIAHFINTQNTFVYDRLDQYSGPIVIPSGEAAAPVQAKGVVNNKMHWEPFYPVYIAGKTTNPLGKSFPATFTAGKGGWNGFPVVTHHQVNTTINKPGYWIFSDTGVYNAHKGTPDSPAVGYIPPGYYHGGI